MNQGSANPGSMIRNVMSNAGARSANASNGGRQDEITVNGTTYRSVNAMVRHCICLQANNDMACGTLVDGGANGGLLGEDMRILEHNLNGHVNIIGMAGDDLTNLRLVQAAALVNTVADGPIVVAMLQHANCGTG